MMNTQLLNLINNQLDKVQTLMDLHLRDRPSKTGEFYAKNLIKELNHNINHIRESSKIMATELGSDWADQFMQKEKIEAYEYFQEQLNLKINEFTKKYLAD